MLQSPRTWINPAQWTQLKGRPFAQSKRFRGTKPTSSRDDDFKQQPLPALGPPPRLAARRKPKPIPAPAGGVRSMLGAAHRIVTLPIFNLGKLRPIGRDAHQTLRLGGIRLLVGLASYSGRPLPEIGHFRHSAFLGLRPLR